MTSASYPTKKPARFILLAGLLVGTLDICAALLDYYIATGKGPENVLRFIASGVFGRDAFTGNSIMMLWGLLFHYVISFGVTIFFFLVYPRISFFRHFPFITGIVFGVFTWVVTTRIILPLSHTPPQAFHFWKAMKAIGILVVMIGLPLSYLFRNYFRKQIVSGKSR